MLGVAIDKLGMRPSQSAVEQAVFQFFSLCLPRGQETGSTLTATCIQRISASVMHGVWLVVP